MQRSLVFFKDYFLLDVKPIMKYEWGENEPRNGADSVVVVTEGSTFKWKSVYSKERFNFICFSVTGNNSLLLQNFEGGVL